MAKLQLDNGHDLWKYVPSMVAAIIFLLLFLITTVLHFWRLIRTRTWFCLPLAIGCLFEVIGYGSRAAAHNRNGSQALYIMQIVLILIAPALYAASIYMTLGRIMRCVKGEHYSIVRITWVTKTFVTCDILSFLIQAGSAALLQNPSSMKIGEGMIVGGLFVQAISFSLFFLNSILFQVRLRRNPTRESYNVDSYWKQCLKMLYSVSILILLRSIFRVVEYISGRNGYPLTHEWTMYIFDSVPMFFVTAIFYVWHPSSLQQPPVEEGNISMSLSNRSAKA